MGSALAVVHRNLIVALAARHKLPAVYYERFYVAAGGLISYGPENAEDFVRRDCKAWQESMEQNAKATRRDIEDTRRGAGATENNS